MRERVIEDLVHQYPEEFFGETLKIVDRQMQVEGRRLDLLFEDSQGGLLLLEIKTGEILREHVGQAGEYFGLLRLRFPDRKIRIALLGTTIPQERQLFLETMGMEVIMVSEEFLLDVAEKYGIDPEVGIPMLSESRNGKTNGSCRADNRFPVTDEASYFKLLDQRSDEATKEKLIAIYALAKQNPYMRISFAKAGSAEVTVLGGGSKKAKLLKVGICFKFNPPAGIITLYWKYMLKTFSPEQIRSFATQVDELLNRKKADIYLDSKQTEGTFDIIHPADLDEHRFARLLEALDNLPQELFGRA